MKHHTPATLAIAACLACSLAGCASGAQDSASAGTNTSTAVQTSAQASATSDSTTTSGTTTTNAATTSNATTTQANAAATQLPASTGGLFDPSTLFTDRDLEQTADTSSAQTVQLADGSDVNITSEGVYVITGSATNVTIYVDADDQAKVQLVFDNATITNETMPAVYVRSADKVFITTVGESTLRTTGTFVADGDTNVDGVIFSKDDVVLNGTGTLVVESSANGIVSKDDLKVTGGSYRINAAGHALDANDSIAVAAGTFDITAGTDGLHASNDEDDSLGYIYVADGTFAIAAGSDGIGGISAVQIDGGTFTINGVEGIEATYVQINGGNLGINASDDGINASLKSTSYPAKIEITGGNVAVTMAAGDTDAIDSNGDIAITGGSLDINAQFAFDYVGQATFTGGTITVNGQQITEIANSMMGGGQMGGKMGGGRMAPGQGGAMPEGAPGQGGMMPEGAPGQGGMMPNQGGAQPA